MQQNIFQAALQILLVWPLLTGLQTAFAADDITQLSIEELMNREVTSVSRSTQKLSDSAAAVFVISEEDIRRSGATVLPEVLRMVPGLHVARLNASQWAITARGFNGVFANKLLVLVDGRSVYTPIFSGVYWEAMDLPLADIERIEVIRGPGASLWGANAVNGIINIITKNARDTQGGFASLGIGDEEKINVDLRYGDYLGEQIYFRGYAKYAQRDGLIDDADKDAGDDWDLARGGFRVDWLASPSDLVMLQGDVYDNDMERNFALASFASPSGTERVLDDSDLSGYSLMARWEQTPSLASRSALQLYYQREQREDRFEDYRIDTIDIDFQREFALSETQELIWGLGYRYHQDDFGQAEQLSRSPKERDYSLLSAFIQDRLSFFDDRLEFTLGSKVEHNTFTGWEFQPSLRALWKPAANQRLWAAVSRATRTPSRGEQDSTITIAAAPPGPDNPASLVVVQGNRDFDSEQLTAYEIGYRVWPADNLYLDFVAFYNDYDDLRFGVIDTSGVTPGTEFVTVPAEIVNGEKSQSYGLEIAADWRPAEYWRLQLGYSYLHANFQLKDGRDGMVTFPAVLGDDRTPRYQLSLRSSFDLPQDLELDVWMRYVDDISDIQVGSPAGIGSVDDYLTLDLRLGWRASETLEFSLSGRNLIDSPHAEFLKEVNSLPIQVERSIYGQVKWRF